MSGSYSYHTYRPHVVTSVSYSGGSDTYLHDENGNITDRNGDAITYNAF